MRLIDDEALLSHVGGDAAFMERILGIFIREAPARTEAIDAAVAAQDLGALRSAVHGLRGSSLTLRAGPLGAATCSTEAEILEAMKTPGFHGLEVSAQSLKALLARTVEEARGLIGGQGAIGDVREEDPRHPVRPTAS